MRNKTMKMFGKIAEGLGSSLYRCMESLDGENSPKIRIVPYRLAEPLKIFSLRLIYKGGSND